VILGAILLASLAFWIGRLWPTTPRTSDEPQQHEGEAGSIFEQSLLTTPSPTFSVVNLRVEEGERPAKIGTCREYNTVVTVVTDSALFADRPGSLDLIARDTSPKDPADGGDWVIRNCTMYPISLDARSYGLFASDIGPRDDLRKAGHTASCTLTLYKNCFAPEVGGDWEKGRAIERERPHYEFKLVSWSVADGIEGTLLQ
jgi:hypothetical protein